MVRLRTRPVFRKIEESPQSRILVVCHGGMIRASLCGLPGLTFSKHLGNTSITKLLYDEEAKLYYLETLNDHQHLVTQRALP